MATRAGLLVAMAWRCAVLMTVAVLSLAMAGPAADMRVDLHGAGGLAFTPPAAGTYVLQHIQMVPDGQVIDSDGRRAALSRFTTGRVTLLGFMYTYCSDPAGCPLAYATFMTIRQHLLAHPALAQRVRLVSLSFDPGHDTPAAMAAYAGRLAGPDAGVEWAFLTTASTEALRPIVDGLGQSVQVQRDNDGHPTRFFDHMLKVFLIDAGGCVREIYSTAYLQPAVMVNDIVTLLTEAPLSARAATGRQQPGGGQAQR